MNPGSAFYLSRNFFSPLADRAVSKTAAVRLPQRTNSIGSALASTAPLFAAIFVLLAPAAAFAGPQDGLSALSEEWDRSTPRRSLQLYLDSCRENRYDDAAYLLDLSHIAAGSQAKKAAVLARKLKFVLDQTVWFDLELISDEPSGDPEDGRTTETVAEIPLGRGVVPIIMNRRALPGGDIAWLISSRTLQRVDDLYREYGSPWITELLPPVFSEIRLGEWMLWQIVSLGAILLIAFAAAFLISFPVLGLSGWIAGRTGYKWDDVLLAASRWPVRLFLALLITNIASGYLRLSVPAAATLSGLLGSGLILVVAWLISRSVSILSASLMQSLREQNGEGRGADINLELKARGARTQIIVLRRVIQIIVFILAGALILTQFEFLRRIGTSLLASAGVAGVVIGLAAQKTISNILAGIQLAITQPIRIGDTVILEGEWGQIEEINLTYVVLKIWDLRRLIVPVSRVLDSPFENWTKTNPELLGSIYFHADYTVPIEKLREELKRFVNDRPDWDRQTCGVLVTKATEHAIEVRALISAADASDQWNLRCAVREHMIAYLQRLDDGRYLPKSRIAGALKSIPDR
ncbi:MAG: mechanosensitive ion channel [Leptospirales bacterium]|jgi:small-conductance mechanosensitive channel